MALKATYTFVDINKVHARASLWVASNVQAGVLNTAIQLVTNAGALTYGVTEYQPQFGTATSALYSGCPDKAVLAFRSTVNRRVLLEVPAPKSGLFLADNETVDPADPLGIIASYLSFAQDQDGNAISAFVGGRRTRAHIW
jgi:hypothetical protein